MNKRKTVLVGLCLLLTTILFGCAAGQDKQKIFDDTTAILQEGDSYTFVNRTGNSDSEEATALAYTGFSGVQTICAMDVSVTSEVDFDFNSTVDTGDFKVVLVTPGKAVVTLLIGTQQGATTQEMMPGKYAVKLVGRKADGQFSIVLKPGLNVSLIKTN